MRLLVTEAAAQPPRQATAWLIMTLAKKMKNITSLALSIALTVVAEAQQFTQWVTPNSAAASGHTVWAGTFYTGPAALSIDKNITTAWTLEGMGWIDFDLGSSKVIRGVEAYWGGHVSNGNTINIYIDGVKVVSNFKCGATTNTIPITPRSGSVVRYETVALPHNVYNQIATWSEIAEFKVLVEVVPPTPPSVAISSAVRLAWATQVGYTYYPQKSSDMLNWQDIGVSFLGDGNEREYFHSTSGTDKIFFRIRIQ